MADEVKLPLKTCRFRVRDKTSGKTLEAAARAVNTVWNHCNGAQRHALKQHQRWPGKARLQNATAGSGKLLGIPAQTVQEVCDEYVDRRRGSNKAKLRWRGQRSLGWVPFKNQTITLKAARVAFNGFKDSPVETPGDRRPHQIRVVLARRSRPLVLQSRGRRQAETARSERRGGH